MAAVRRDRPGRAGARVMPLTLDEGDESDETSERSKARSRADWNRSYGFFSRQ